MDSTGKKVSFGFSKVSKQNPLKQVATTNKEIQYIDCLDSKTIVCKKVEDEIEEKKIDLWIPLKRVVEQNNGNLSEKEDNVCAGKKDTIQDTTKTENIKEQSLEEKAVKEILNDAMKCKDIKEESKSSRLIVLKSGERIESTLDDYENIPVRDFGTAMLRGMGWKPGKSTCKSGKVFSTKAPQIRPVGMGLGADKVQRTTAQKPVSNDDEELKISKGAYVKVMAGSRKGQYGQIEGFLDEDSGRMIVKLAMQATPISLSECSVEPVTKEEYVKNSRVLNVSKYEEYKIKSEEFSESKQLDTDTKQHGVDRNSADNVSDSEKRSFRTDTSSEDKDDTEKKKHKTERISESRADSEVKRHRTNRNSKERTSDDCRRNQRLDRSPQDRDNSERKKHRKHRNSEESSDDGKTRRHRSDKYFKERLDGDSRRKQRNNRNHDSDRRRHRKD